MDGAPKVLTYDGTNPMMRKAAMSFSDGGYSGKVPIVKPSPAFLAGARTDRDAFQLLKQIRSTSPAEAAEIRRLAHLCRLEAKTAERRE